MLGFLDDFALLADDFHRNPQAFAHLHKPQLEKRNPLEEMIFVKRRNVIRIVLQGLRKDDKQQARSAILTMRVAQTVLRAAILAVNRCSFHKISGRWSVVGGQLRFLTDHRPLTTDS